MMERYIAFKTVSNDIQATDTRYRSTYPAIPSDEVYNTKVYERTSDPVYPVKEAEYTSRLHSADNSRYTDLMTNILPAEYDVLYKLSGNGYSYHALILKAKEDNKLYIADEVCHSSDSVKNKFFSKWEFFEIKECKARVNAAQRKREAIEKARNLNASTFESFFLPSITALVEKAGLKITPIYSQVNQFEIYVDPDMLCKHQT